MTNPIYFLITPFYNADNFEFMSAKPEQILNRLKKKKSEMMRDEEDAKTRMGSFYETVRGLLAGSEQQSLALLNQEMLGFHQRIGEAVKHLSSKTKSGDYQLEISKTVELLEYNIVDGPKIDESKLSTLFAGLYESKITNQPRKIEQSDILNDFPDLLQSDNSMGFKQSAGDFALQKLQGQRDYYQRREHELLSRIKQLQNSMMRKGISIKEMSRSHLEDKCSRWALDRLKEEKRVLVEKIGEASQEIIRLTNLAGEQQAEIRKLSSFNEANSRSGVSVMKNSSLIVDWEGSKRQRPVIMEQVYTERQTQLECKNEQLMVEVTKLLKNEKEQSQKLQWCEGQLQTQCQMVAQLNGEIDELKQLNLIVNHDYEISLRRKAVCEQECGDLKNQLTRIKEQAVEEKESYSTVIAGLQQKLAEMVEQGKRMERSKRQEMGLMESRVKAIQLQRQSLLKRVEEASSKKGEEINYKQLLNDQITRLLKQNAGLSSSLEQKQSCLFFTKQQNAKLSNELKQTQSKIEQSKRESVRFKKQSKDLEKHIAELQKQISDRINLQYKVAQLEQNCIMLESEFAKYKQSSDRKMSVSLRTMQIIKERFSAQLGAVLSDQLKAKGKKGQNRLDLIDKYIEEMAGLSNKSALIKQLKDENRLLKEGKEAKLVVKKTKCLFTEQTVVELENGLWTMATKILEERLKSEKELFDLQLKELKEAVAKEQMHKLGMQQQLERQRQASALLRSQQRQQPPNEDLTKTLKQYEQRLERMQSDLKGNRAMIRKLQNQIAEDQSEIKVKRQLAVGLKRECRQKDELMRQLQNELAANQDELQKMKRNSKEMAKKQTMFKQIRDKQGQLEEKNAGQKKTIDALEEKLRTVTKQLDKKESILRELRCIEQKQNKTKQEERTQETNETIIEQRDVIRKIKAEVDRKDEIIKNLRAKTETKSKQFQTVQCSNQKEIEKCKKELEGVQRKLQVSKSALKKQQSKNYLLVMAIKKIYEYLAGQNSRQQQTANNKRRQSTQYFSGSSASSHALKSVTPINAKAIPHYEGLAILNLSTQDLMEFQNEPTVVSKIQAPLQSFEIGSPRIEKRRINNEQVLLQGLQQLQKTLSQKQIDTSSILNIFRRVLQR